MAEVKNLTSPTTNQRETFYTYCSVMLLGFDKKKNTHISSGRVTGLSHSQNMDLIDLELCGSPACNKPTHYYHQYIK